MDPGVAGGLGQTAVNGDHAAALERLKTFAAEAVADAGPSHAHDVALVLELLRDARLACMAAVCVRESRRGPFIVAGEPDLEHEAVEPTHGIMTGGSFTPCPAYAIRALPGGA